MVCELHDVVSGEHSAAVACRQRKQRRSQDAAVGGAGAQGNDPGNIFLPTRTHSGLLVRKMSDETKGGEGQFIYQMLWSDSIWSKLVLAECWAEYGGSMVLYQLLKVLHHDGGE